MDQNKNQGHQPQSNQGQTQNPNREPAEGKRKEMPGQGTQPGRTNREKGAGSQRDRTSGEGISNRGMDRELEEQEELPDRGSGQSER